MGETRRLHYIDTLRVIACMMVVIIHVTSDYIYMGKSDAGASLNVSLVLNTMSRSCIGLFLMISGALVLKKSAPLFKIVKQSLRYLYLYLLWSAFYSIVTVVHTGDYSIKSCVETFLRGKYHLWYLLLISFIYAIIPLFKSVDVKSLKWVSFVCILLGVVVPSLNVGNWDLMNNSICSPVLAYIGYFILGYLLGRSGGSGWYLIPLVVLLVIHSDMSIKSYMSSGEFSVYLSDYNNMIVFLEVVCVFLTVKGIVSKGCKFIEVISSASFGIYLIHVLFIDIFRNTGLFHQLHVVVAIVAIFTLAFGIAWVIGKIKPLKWLIF